MMKAMIRLAQPEDNIAVADFCQPIYAAVYPNDKYGMRPEHFSSDVFSSPRTQEYIAETMLNHNLQRAFIAENAGAIVGTISIERSEQYYDIHAFYVDPAFQGRGIGRNLMARALKFCTDNVPVRAEVAETNDRAIGMYRHWGFDEAPELGLSLRHWPEWPDGLHNGYIFFTASAKEIHV